MKSRWKFDMSFVAAILCACSAFATHSRLAGAKGECIFTKEFLQDYKTAEKSVHELKSVEPFLALLTKYQKPEEQAELQLSIGIEYGQRKGIIDYAKAVIYFSRALEFDLPERTYIEICTWRGNSYEILKKYPEALRDYIRVLLACSYRDLGGGWPEILPATVTLYMNSEDPENHQRSKDYQRYSNEIELQRFLIMRRYFLIDAVKRVRTVGSIDDESFIKAVKELTPDTRRSEVITGLLKTENKRPWP